jgi:hypothetical protein
LHLESNIIFEGEHDRMAREIADWVCTGAIAAMSIFAGFAYLPGNRRRWKLMAALETME